MFGRCVDEYRPIQARQSERVCDGTLVSEIRQGNDDPFDALARASKERRAALRFFVRFHSAVLPLFRAENHQVNSSGLENLDHLLAAPFRHVIGKKSPTPDDETECVPSPHYYRRSLAQLFPSLIA